MQEAWKLLAKTNNKYIEKHSILMFVYILQCFAIDKYWQ